VSAPIEISFNGWPSYLRVLWILNTALDWLTTEEVATHAQISVYRAYVQLWRLNKKKRVVARGRAPQQWRLKKFAGGSDPHAQNPPAHT
jgi:hypothetical protein